MLQFEVFVAYFDISGAVETWWWTEVELWDRKQKKEENIMM